MQPWEMRSRSGNTNVGKIQSTQIEKVTALAEIDWLI
jgi:hypothetical protein